MSIHAIKLEDTITLTHGSGGKAMHALIEQLIHTRFDNQQFSNGEDQARLGLDELNSFGDRLAFTTDSFVVDPLFFPGGNIGKLAVCGTVNDLAVGGAKPLYLSCSLIIEEGLPLNVLSDVLDAMQHTAAEAGVRIVTGDTKVVARGQCDKLFINTAGVGVIPARINVSAGLCQPGDKIIVNGYLGDHGAAIVDARGELALQNTVLSDCAPLNHLIQSMLELCPDIRCMRDATRGGIATVLNEFAQASKLNMELDETSIPVRAEVRGVCELLGLDPLYLANEGKVVCVVPEQHANAMVEMMRSHAIGKHSQIIGTVTEPQTPSAQQRVLLVTQFGSSRVVDMLVGEQLPRIC